MIGLMLMLVVELWMRERWSGIVILVVVVVVAYV